MSVTFDEQSAQRIGRATRRVEAMPVDGRAVPRKQSGVGDIAPTYIVTAATRDGGNWRWAYTLKRALWDGSYGWTGVGDALSGRNLVEAGNGSSGTVSGITLDSKVVGIKPIPTNQPVFAWVTYAADGTAAYVFERSNAPDIDCG